MNKRWFTIMIFISCFLYLNPAAHGWDSPLIVDVDYIKFDYDHSSTTDDGVDIRVDKNTDITYPEWQNGGQVNEEMAYIKSQSSRKIKAEFTHNQDDVYSLTILAEHDGTGIGELYSTEIDFQNGGHSSGEETLSLTGSVPGSVGKRSFDWKWYVEEVNGQPYQGGGMLHFETTGDHDHYTLLDSPQSPMEEPWTEVLDYACDWASGESNVSSVSSKITKKIYSELGLSYDTKYGSPSYTNNGGSATFHLTDFLNDIPGESLDFNCHDTGKAVKTFANATGCGLSYEFCSPFGYLNCIKPAGKGWANNPFYDYGYPYSSDPIVGEDDDYEDGRSRFANHAFASYGSDIYDASLKVDTDVNPDYGPPFSESWTIGWSWNTYKNNVIDDNPPSSTGSPDTCSFDID